jgi:nicotinamidase-related amidase
MKKNNNLRSYDNTVQYIQRLVQQYRKQDYPITHVIRLYRPDGSNVDLFRRQVIGNGKQVVIARSDGAQLMDELKPSPNIKLNSSYYFQAGFSKLGLWS